MSILPRSSGPAAPVGDSWPPVRQVTVAVLIAVLIAVFTGTQQYETAVAEGLHQSWVRIFTPQAFLWTTWALLLPAILFVNQRIDRVRGLIGRIGALALTGRSPRSQMWPSCSRCASS